MAGFHHDCEGRPPTHTFFYPWDEYDPEELRELAELCAGGWGEVELHLHHRDDTEDSLRDKLRAAVAAFVEHGLLTRWPDGRPAFGFVHGDWALCNSRGDGGRSYCGVNNELELLAQEGCYADFTFPAWRHTSQPRLVNRLYFASSRKDRPGGHLTGLPARVGGGTPGQMLMVQGPLVPHWRRGGRLPVAVDDGDLGAHHRYHPARLDAWVRAAIQVQGRPDRLFIKLHCHGAPDANRDALLNRDLPALFTDAESRFNDGSRYRLHYLTAREMANLIWATIDGAEVSPSDARHYRLPSPAVQGALVPGVTGDRPERVARTIG
jgi:hypothetical protein